MCSLFISSSNPSRTGFLKSFLPGFLVFIFLFFACDRIMYLILNTGFRRTTTGEAGGIVNKVLQENFDIVILGSSRAVLHYDPRILGSKLNMSAYNAGCNGQELHYMRGLVDLILKKQTPAITIIDVHLGSVRDAAIDLSKAATLAPFMDDSAIIQRMLYSKGPLEKLKYLSLTYRFNSKPLAIFKNLFIEDQTIAGFAPRRGVMDPGKVVDKIYPAVGADQEMLDLLREIIVQLKGSGSQVVIVLSPRWTKEGRVAPYRLPALRQIRELAKSERISFLAVTSESTPVFQRSEFFKDASHLNAEGARIFSEILAEKLAVLRENQFQPVYDEL